MWGRNNLPVRIAKLFSFAELLARLRALRRRVVRELSGAENRPGRDSDVWLALPREAA
jgi:DNA-binding response OmpR family regulator